MKLQTSIIPRRDGTVVVTGQDGKKYTFKTDDEGELSGEIEHAPTVASLLAGGLFYPADAADYDAALELSAPADDGEMDEHDEGSGLPVEANTPPGRKKPGPKPKAAA